MAANKERSSRQKAKQSGNTRTTVRKVGRPPKNKNSLPEKRIKKGSKSPSIQLKRGRPPNAVKKKTNLVQPKSTPASKKREIKQEVENVCDKCSRSFNSLAGLKIHRSRCKGITVESDGTNDQTSPKKNVAKTVVFNSTPRAKDVDSPALNKNSPSLNNNHEKRQIISQPRDNSTDITPYRQGSFTCSCCGEDLATCHVTGDFECNECGAKFILESSLRRHRQTKHTSLLLLKSASYLYGSNSTNGTGNTNGSNEPMTCYCCDEDLLTAHIAGEFQCHECGKKFKLKSSIEKHMKVMHSAGGGNLECPQCEAKCPDKGTLARHLYTHTGLKPYSCQVCGQEFSRKYHLVRHNMQTGCDGSKRPIFPCQVCGREFNRKDNLREHLRAHAGQTKRKKIFSCDTCGLEFSGTTLLIVHKRTHSGEKPYACDFCPKTFPSSGALKKHRRTHTGERPYECMICHKKFGAKETLNRHTRIHTGFKPHGCQYCGKRFIQSSQLKSHLFYHTGQSVLQPAVSFPCNMCGKIFNRRARLNEHLKFVHFGAKPFECDICNKTFIRKEDLTRHMIIHSGIKAHKCPICSKAFAMKSSLKVHLLTHTKEQPRSCDECGRAFIRQDCLLRHMRNKHRDMLEKIMSEAEKKKLQQQLLQMAAEATQLEEHKELSPEALSNSVRELLALLVDEVTLQGLGWPNASVHQLLEAVIRRCGHEPASSDVPGEEPSPAQLRHNVKLLFTVVIDDSAVKALLNNQTVDEVIMHVLRLAKS